MENSKSNYVRILYEICREEGIEVSSYSSDWAFRLEKGGKRAFILGYQFGLNSASTQQVCKDKNITSEVLADVGVPCVFHTLFMAPSMLSYVGSDGSWAPMSEALKKGPLVVKDNYGTGGNQVFLARTQPELEKACAEVFSRSLAAAVCPYEEILDEYRLVVLDGEIRLAFSKIRPFLKGDGKRSLRSLAAQALAEGKGAFPDLSALGKDRVPAKGEKVYLNWKHNLGQGAKAKRIAADRLPEELRELALRAAEAVALRFGSVDIIRTEEGLKVLEINGGVMMEHYAGESSRKYREAKEIYRDALLKMF